MERAAPTMALCNGAEEGQASRTGLLHKDQKSSQEQLPGDLRVRKSPAAFNWDVRTG